MPLASESAFAPGTEIAGHLVLTAVPSERGHVRLRARDGRGRGAEMAIAIETGADETSLGLARRQAQGLAGVPNAGFCVPTDVCLTDHGLVTIRPWFDTLLVDGARTAGLSVRACLQLIIDLARTLDGAHRRGLSHGSVTASNVAVDADGRGRLVDARPTIAPAEHDTVALGELSRDWLRGYDAGPLIDLAVEHCAAAAAGDVAAGDLADSLAALVEAADQAQDTGSDTTARTPARRTGWAGAVVAAAAVVVAGAAMVWAGSMDRSAETPAVAATPLAACDAADAGSDTVGAETMLADLYAQGCSVGVTWWPSRAEAEIAVGPSLGRFRLGERGDQLLLGDWDGDAAAEPALYRPSTGEVFSWDAWPVDDTPAPSASRSDTGVVGGIPVVVVEGGRHRVHVAHGTPT